MAVAIDSSAEAKAPSATSFNFTALTIGASLSNSALLVGIAAQTTTISGVAMTWNGVSLTQIGTDNVTNGTNGTVQLWGLINPAAGNNTLAITWGGTEQMTVWAASFSGVDQTGGTTSFPNFTSAKAAIATPSTPSTITVTSASGHATFAVHSAGDTSVNANSVDNNAVGVGHDSSSAVSAGANYATTGSNTTLSCTWSGNSQWAASGVDIKSAGGGTFLPYDPWPQFAPILAQ
jgi:hypothetical protein